MKRILVSNVAESFGLMNVTPKEMENVNGGVGKVPLTPAQAAVIAAGIAAIASITVAIIENKSQTPSTPSQPTVQCAICYNSTYSPSITVNKRC